MCLMAMSSQQNLADMVTNFHELHERLYTYNLPHQTVELVNLRVTALGSLPRPTLRTGNRT